MKNLCHRKSNIRIMAPTSTQEPATNGHTTPSTQAMHEPGLSEAKAKVQMPKFPGPPKFLDRYEEREYLKGRLAAAFRIFGMYSQDLSIRFLANNIFHRQVWLRRGCCRPYNIARSSSARYFLGNAPVPGFDVGHGCLTLHR